MQRFTVEVENEGTTLRVTADYSSGEENRQGHPDTWAPAWSVFEIIEIVTTEGESLEVSARFCEDRAFLRAVEREILEIVESHT